MLRNSARQSTAARLLYWCSSWLWALSRARRHAPTSFLRSGGGGSSRYRVTSIASMAAPARTLASSACSTGCPCRTPTAEASQEAAAQAREALNRLRSLTASISCAQQQVFAARGQAASHLKAELRRWREVFQIVRHLPVARFHLHDADTLLDI